MKTAVALVLAMVLCLSACASEKQLTVPAKDGSGRQVTRVFRPYGFFDYMDLKDPRVEYRVVVGNVAWSVITGGSIIIPLALCGWYLYEPVGPAVEVE